MRPGDALQFKDRHSRSPNGIARSKKARVLHTSGKGPRPFHDAKVGDLALVKFKFQQGADLVKSRLAHSSRVQVQSAPAFSALNEQDVAVAANEQVGA